MNINFNEWQKVNEYDLSKVVDMVITGGTVESISDDYWLISYMENGLESNSILDFGCGVGRNILKFCQDKPNWNFIGYDNDDMLGKLKEYSTLKFNKTIDQYDNLTLMSDWNVLKNKKFDCIYATVVFQHIHEKDLNNYLRDFKKMTNKLIVSGRRFNDDMVDGRYKNTWQILENMGYYPSNAKEINYKIDGDPDEHYYIVYTSF